MTNTIAIIEDNVEFMAYFAQLFERNTHFKIKYKAVDFKEGLALLPLSPAKIVFIDLGLPDGSGLDLIKKITRAWPDSTVIVLSIFAGTQSIISAIQQGAAGYLHKDEPENRFMEGLNDILAGNPNISPMIARSLLSFFRPEPEPDLESEPQQHAALTKRETEVLTLYKKGLTRKEIAGHLDISVNTVSTYIKRTFKKLGVNSIREAIYEEPDPV
jgi:DNA-binding NarL/FixJ family response regulator